MDELISKGKLLADLKEIEEVLASAGDPFLASMIRRAIRCVEEQPVMWTAGIDYANEWETRRLARFALQHNDASIDVPHSLDGGESMDLPYQVFNVSGQCVMHAPEATDIPGELS